MTILVNVFLWKYVCISAAYTPMNRFSGSLHIHISEPKECIILSKIKIQSKQMELNNITEN